MYPRVLKLVHCMPEGFFFILLFFLSRETAKNTNTEHTNPPRALCCPRQARPGAPVSSSVSTPTATRRPVCLLSCWMSSRCRCPCLLLLLLCILVCSFRHRTAAVQSVPRFTISLKLNLKQIEPGRNKPNTNKKRARFLHTPQAAAGDEALRGRCGEGTHFQPACLPVASPMRAVSLATFAR